MVDNGPDHEGGCKVDNEAAHKPGEKLITNSVTRQITKPSPSLTRNGEEDQRGRARGRFIK